MAGEIEKVELLEVLPNGTTFIPVARAAYILDVSSRFSRNFTLLYKHKNTSEIEKEYLVRITAQGDSTDYPFIAENDYMIGVTRYDQLYPLSTVPLTDCS